MNVATKPNACILNSLLSTYKSILSTMSNQLIFDIFNFVIAKPFTIQIWIYTELAIYYHIDTDNLDLAILSYIAI